MDKKILFSLTAAQNIANGSAIYTEFVFDKLIKEKKSFEVYYNPQIKKNVAIIKKIPKEIISHKCSNLKELETLLQERKYDKVFFGSEKDTDVELPDNITPIVVVHDLRFIELPNDKTRYLYRETFIERTKQVIISKVNPEIGAKIQKKRLLEFMHHPKLKIVTVSNHTKYSILLNFPNIKKGQVHVLYCPYPDIEQINKNDSFNTDILYNLGLSNKNYFLIISAGRWFKNSYRAITAFDNLASGEFLKDKKVLVLGLPEKSLIKNVKNKEIFVFKKFVRNNELQHLYKNAYGFVYPSLQEGFGIPPVEAMSYGIPVLASSIASIHEICRAGAYYFNPYSIMEIENRILHLLNDNEFYKIRCDESLKRSNEISLKQKKDLGKLVELIFG